MSKHHRHRRRRSRGGRRGIPQGQQSRPPVASGEKPPRDTPPPAVPRVRTAAPAAQTGHGNPRLGRDLRNIGIVTALMVILLTVLARVL